MSFWFKIYYYIPKEFEKRTDFKLKLLEANEVKVVVIDKTHGFSYYQEILTKF
jgi:hypothetical protein